MGVISEIDTAPEKIGWLSEAMIATRRDWNENKRYPSLETPRGSRSLG